MKVLLLTDADVFAGTERHIFDLACALHQNDSRDSDSRDANSAASSVMEVRVACPVPSPLAARCQQAQLRVLDVPKRGFIDWNAVRILRRELKSRRAEVIHAHNGRTALAAALAVFLARRGSLVTTQHFLAPNRTTQSGIKAKISDAAHRWVAKQTHAVIAISQSVRDASLSRGESSGKITVVPNGIPDVAHDEHRVLDISQDESQTLEIGDQIFILCAARLEKEKDIATLINAMKIVAQDEPSALCLVAGEGALRDDLQAHIDKLSLQNNVRLLGFRDDVLSLMRACDVFVLPSLAEPFGLVLIEAMAFGKPVVATRAGGPLEIVAEGESGFLVAPSSGEELADALLKLLRDQTLRETMGAASRMRYERQFTASRMAREIAAVYARAMEEV